MACSSAEAAADVQSAIAEVGYELDDEVLAESLAIAESIPDADDRGGFVSRAVAADPEAAPLDRIVAHLGRSPSWPD